MSADSGWLALFELFRLVWEMGALAVMTVRLMQDDDGRIILAGLIVLVAAIVAVAVLVTRLRRNRSSTESSTEPTRHP